jgi:hypothetical protein
MQMQCVGRGEWVRIVSRPRGQQAPPQGGCKTPPLPGVSIPARDVGAIAAVERGCDVPPPAWGDNSRSATGSAMGNFHYS